MLVLQAQKMLICIKNLNGVFLLNSVEEQELSKG